MKKYNVYRGEIEWEFVGTVWAADSGEAAKNAREEFGVDVWVVPAVNPSPDEMADRLTGFLDAWSE